MGKSIKYLRRVRQFAAKLQGSLALIICLCRFIYRPGDRVVDRSLPVGFEPHRVRQLEAARVLMVTQVDQMNAVPDFGFGHPCLDRLPALIWFYHEIDFVKLV